MGSRGEGRFLPFPADLSELLCVVEMRDTER